MNNKSMPIFERLPCVNKMTKGQVDQQVRDILRQIKTAQSCQKISTVVPRRVFENASFIVNTNYLKMVDDILADESGVWLNNGKRTSNYKRSMCDDDFERNHDVSTDRDLTKIVENFKKLSHLSQVFLSFMCTFYLYTIYSLITFI